MQALPISAVDDDVNSGTRITYSLAGEYHHVFDIDPVTAEVCVNQKYAGKIDRETMQTYYLKVRSCWNFGGSALQSV